MPLMEKAISASVKSWQWCIFNSSY